jgi:putative redox protein
MDEKVIWKNDLSFVNDGGGKLAIPLRAAPSVGEDDAGYEPMELIAIGLAGCTAMDVISILHKKRQDVTAFEVKVHAARAVEFPKVFTNILIEYIVEGHQVEPAAVERSIELSSTKYCPVQAMLNKACKIEHTYTIKDAGVAHDPQPIIN